jgi:dihydrolipoamide dehydrogenase
VAAALAEGSRRNCGSFIVEEAVMAEISESELVVIGAGPGGYAAAFLAADKGMKVTLIDANAKLGGTCLLVGCIPSKTLLHAAKVITEAQEAAGWGIHFTKPKIDVAALRGYWNKVVDTLSKNLGDLSKRRNVQVINARASFVDSTTLQLDPPSAPAGGKGGERLRFRNCILATGSSPVFPPGLKVDNPRVMDSTGALKLEDVPGSLLVVGGGYIGLEMGTVYAALGSKVTVVEMTDGLLPGVDRDLVRPLQARLNTLFHKILLNTKVTKMEAASKGIRASLEGAEVEDKEPVFDRVLVAVGRRPNSRGLGLENTRVQVNDKGFVQVDRQMRSQDEHIFAIGDVAGEPMLAHKASHEGKVAVEVIAGEKVVFDSRAIPAVVFTDPEIAWCGLTESEARAQKREVKVGRFPWGASGRAISLGRPDGLTKIITDPASDIILGVGLVGTGAGELIAEGVLAVEMAATARDLALSIHPHPTLSETMGEAAETLHGLSTHLYRTRKS